MSTAVAVTECSVVRLEKSAMIAVLHDEPVFSALFILYLLTRNIRIEEDLVDQLFQFERKTAGAPSFAIGNFGKEGKPEPVIPKVSQETLAEMIGTTRSRVSFFACAEDVVAGAGRSRGRQNPSRLRAADNARDPEVAIRAHPRLGRVRYDVGPSRRVYGGAVDVIESILRQT
jgi:hypothetical protein